ncbi:MAG: hypothetical protein RL153_668, partial [Verrucomicrobiota bacterium]
MTNASRLLSVVLVCASANGLLSQSPTQVAEEVAIKRQEKTILLRKSLETAQRLEKEKDFPGAARVYEQAWTLVEELGTSAEAERKQATVGFSALYLRLANDSIKSGEFKEADGRLKRVLAVDPNNSLAKQLKRDNDKRLEEIKGRSPSDAALATIPDRQKELHDASVHEHNGQLYYELGKFDQATEELHAALKLNPESRAAHHYLALIDERKYAQGARRRELTAKDRIVDVEYGWDTPVSKLPEANPFARTNTIYTGRGRQVISHKLDRIRLNELKIEGLPLGEVVKNLEEQARLRDPERKGLNFIISSSVDIPQQQQQLPQVDAQGNPIPAPPVEPVDVSQINIRLMPGLRDVRLADALDAITKVADKPIKYSIEDYAIVFTQRTPQADLLFTRRFRVNPNTFYQGLESVIGLPLPIDGGSGGAGGGGGGGGGMGGGGMGGGGMGGGM